MSIPHVGGARRSRRSAYAAWLFRRRGHGRRTVTGSLAQTHTFGPSVATIDTDVLFPNRFLPVTVALRLRRDAVTASGMLFEFGGAAVGMAAWVDGTEIGFGAGGGSGDTGVTATVSGIMNADDQVVDLVFCAEPGLPNDATRSRIRFWADGVLKATAYSVDQMPSAPDGWAGNADGATGQVNGAITPRVPAPQQITLVDATIVSNVNVFYRQAPLVR